MFHQGQNGILSRLTVPVNVGFLFSKKLFTPSMLSFVPAIWTNFLESKMCASSGVGGQYTIMSCIIFVLTRDVFSVMSSASLSAYSTVS